MDKELQLIINTFCVNSKTCKFKSDIIIQKVYLKLFGKYFSCEECIKALLKAFESESDISLEMI